MGNENHEEILPATFALKNPDEEYSNTIVHLLNELETLVYGSYSVWQDITVPYRTKYQEGELVLIRPVNLNKPFQACIIPGLS